MSELVGKILAYAIMVVVGLLVGWLSVGFIRWDLNISNWPESDRALILIAMVVSYVLHQWTRARG